MAPPLEPPASITLKVKVPPGYLSSNDPSVPTVDEFLLGAVNVSANIGSIRQRIQQLVPSHPAPESQRLLYGGRALVDNEQSVADALNTKRDPAQSEYVIHLLVRAEGANSRPARATGNSTDTNGRVGANVTAPNAQQPPIAPGQPPHALDEHQQLLQRAHQAHHAQVAHQQQMARLAQMRMLGPLHQGGVLQNMPHGPAPVGAQFPPAIPPAPYGFPQNTPGIPQQWWQRPVGEQQHNGVNVAMNAHGQQELPGSGSQPTRSSQSTPVSQHEGSIPTQARTEAQDTTGHTPAPQTDERTPAQHEGQNVQAAPRHIVGRGFHFDGIGPNGQRIQIHHQTLHPPMMGGVPFNAQPPLGNPLAGAASSSGPGMPPAQALDRRMTALERSRRDIVEMRTSLNEVQSSAGITAEQRRRIEEAQARIDRLSDYIDPFRIGSTHTSTPSNADAPPAASAPGLLNITSAQPPFPLTQPRGISPQVQLPASGSQDVTCYLLSSPQGPQALLFSPQHGMYAGSYPLQHPINPAMMGFHPTPTTAPQGGAAAPQDPVAAAVHQHVQAVAAEQAQVQAPPQEPLGPFQPLLGHLWLLMRVLIFAYFLLGSNMGWQRPIVLLVICMGFWLIRMGALRRVAPLQRWWNGIVEVPQAPGQAPAQQQAQQNPAANQPQVVAAADRPAAARRANQMPTPEQVAQRLLEEDAARRRQRGNWLREQFRPVERVIALFLASLWPGIGEAHVRAQEQEQRRRQEEEVERRRREEEQLAKEREEGEKSGDGGQEQARGEGSTESNDEKRPHADVPQTSAQGEVANDQ